MSPAELHLEGIRLRLSGHPAEAVAKLRAADEALNFWPDQAYLKLATRLQLSQALAEAGDDRRGGQGAGRGREASTHRWSSAGGRGRSSPAPAPAPVDLGAGDLRYASRSVITAVVSKKGGVGKTTTAVNLAAALADGGHRVLLVDLDSQASASLSLGVERGALAPSAADVLLWGTPVRQAIRPTGVAGLDLLTASSDLGSVDLELGPLRERELKLRRALEPVRDDYDFVFLDCAPSQSLLAVNALVAADAFLVPVAPQFLAVAGVDSLLDRRRAHPRPLQPRPRAGRGVVDHRRLPGDHHPRERRPAPRRPRQPGVRGGDPGQHPPRRGPRATPRPSSSTTPKPPAPPPTACAPRSSCSAPRSWRGGPRRDRPAPASERRRDDRPSPAVESTQARPTTITLR